MLSSVATYKLARFSQRFAWLTPTNPYSLLLAEKRKSGARLLDLTVSNPTKAIEDYPHHAIASAYGSISSFLYQPEPLGSFPARQAVAKWYGYQGISLSEDRIALTASSSEAYALLFKLLCNPGETVLIPCPSYPLFEYLASAEAIEARPYRLHYDGAWFVDLDSVQKAITPATKAIVVVSPNNPTGSFLTVKEAEALVSLAERHGLAVIADEVFMTYPAGASDPLKLRTFIGNRNVLSFSLNGLSKAAGMPQMKLGWIAVSGPSRERASALAKLELLLDNYLSVGTPVQAALPELLSIGGLIHDKITARLAQNRSALSVFEGTAVQPLASEGGWSTILQVPNATSEEEWIISLLSYHGVIVQPGYFYDMPREAFLVVSLLSEPVRFAEGLKQLLAVVNE